MKSSIKYLMIATLGVMSLSACTMGDKGSTKVADSVKIDTNNKSQAASSAPKTSDTTLIDSLQTDTTHKAK